MNYKVEIAENLLQIKAIKLSPQKPFTWASGIKSPIYCDNRVTLSHPAVRNKLKKAFTEMALTFDGVNTIAGVATAGIPHGTLLADSLNLPYVYVRSSPKAHGRKNLIEGELPNNARVLLVEDLISTGGSSLKAAEALQKNGATVVAVLAIFTYNLEVAEINFKRAAIPYYALSDYPTLLEIAKSKNYISVKEKETLDRWNENPSEWYEKYVKTN